METKINSLDGLGELIAKNRLNSEQGQAQEQPAQVAEVKEVVEQPVVVEEIIDNKTEAKEAPSVEEEKVNSVLSKNFEELLEERTSGKYKSWDDVEKTLTSNPFADEKVSKVNEYIKQGGTFDDWVKTQSINVGSMSAKEKIAMQMSLADPEMTPSEIELEMKLKYGFDKWKGKEEDYEDGIEPDDIKIQKMRFERESQKAEKAIKEYQKKWSVPQVDMESQRREQEMQTNKWNDSVDNSLKTLKKIPIKVSDTQSFDYVISEQEIKDATNTVKQMFTDSNAMFSSYVDPNKPTGVNIEGLAEMVVRAKNFEKILAFAVNQASSSGKEKVVKDIKNIDFKPDGQKQQPIVNTRAAAIAKSLLG